MVVAQRLRDISELLATAVGSDTVNSIGSFRLFGNGLTAFNSIDSPALGPLKLADCSIA